MRISDFKFKVKPLEIVILVVAIVVISVATILIKDYVREEELNNMSIADRTEIQEGDSIIQVDNLQENSSELNTENKENTDNSDKKDKNNNKVVIKKGSTGVLQITSLNILAQITEGSDPQTLKNYVGVVEGSSRPGQIGNYALAAHNNIDTEIFRNLHKIEKGALVNVYTQSKVYTYKVTDMYNVKPTQTEVLDKPNDKKEITLITCNYNASERVIVKGVLVSEKIARNV